MDDRQRFLKQEASVLSDRSVISDAHARYRIFVSSASYPRMRGTRVFKWYVACFGVILHTSHNCDRDRTRFRTIEGAGRDVCLGVHPPRRVAPVSMAMPRPPGLTFTKVGPGSE